MSKFFRPSGDSSLHPILRPAGCSISRSLCLPICVWMLAGCTPAYDWRDVRGADAPFVVLLPAKPSTLTRVVDLGGVKASMTMTAAEINHVTFAVGTAVLPDNAQAQAALEVMKQTLVHNIGGMVRHEKSTHGAIASSIDFDAGTAASAEDAKAPTGAARTGNQGARGAMALHARLLARGQRVYQVIVIGREEAIRPEAVETFLDSFKTE